MATVNGQETDGSWKGDSVSKGRHARSVVGNVTVTSIASGQRMDGSWRTASVFVATQGVHALNVVGNVHLRMEHQFADGCTRTGLSEVVSVFSINSSCPIRIMQVNCLSPCLLLFLHLHSHPPPLTLPRCLQGSLRKPSKCLGRSKRPGKKGRRREPTNYMNYVPTGGPS